MAQISPAVWPRGCSWRPQALRAVSVPAIGGSPRSQSLPEQCNTHHRRDSLISSAWKALIPRWLCIHINNSYALSPSSIPPAQSWDVLAGLISNFGWREKQGICSTATRPGSIAGINAAYAFQSCLSGVINYAWHPADTFSKTKRDDTCFPIMMECQYSKVPWGSFW